MKGDRAEEMRNAYKILNGSLATPKGIPLYKTLGLRDTKIPMITVELDL